MRSHELALTLSGTHDGFDLLGQVTAVIGVDNVLHNHFHAGCRALVIITVIPIVNGNEANAQERKDTFQIVADLHIVTEKAAEILADHHVCLAIFQTFNHPLKRRTVAVGAGIAVIDELNHFIAVKLPAGADKPIQQRALISDALALGLEFQVIVGIRQTDVQVQFLHRASPPSNS